MINIVYRFFAGCENSVVSLKFDSENNTLSVTDTLETDSTVSDIICKGDILYSAFGDTNEHGSTVRSYNNIGGKLSEISSIAYKCNGARDLEFSGDANCLMVANGASGCDTAIICGLSGVFTGDSQFFPHSVENGPEAENAGRYAVCNRMTTNPYRIASMDRSDGAVTVSNIFSRGNEILMRECSRVVLGADKGIKDIVFSDLDIAYILAEDSRELLLIDFHSGSGSLWPLKSYDLPKYNKSILTMTSSNNHLFIADSLGYLYAFKITTDGLLDLCSDNSLINFAPNDICVSDDGKFVFVCSNINDSVKVFEFINSTDVLIERDAISLPCSTCLCSHD